MTSIQYLLVGLLTIHLAMAIYAIIRTIKTIKFSRKQKKLNIILILIVPFIWTVLIYYMLKEEPNSYEIENRDQSSVHYYESGKGAPGSGIGTL
ncbi:MAG TPA: hypothetical protein VGC01_12775 [Mucilaginibacter sp.]